jgi:hypothetical protein
VNSLLTDFASRDCVRIRFTLAPNAMYVPAILLGEKVALDLSTESSDMVADMAAVFQLLPMKDFLFEQKSVYERSGSDQACTAAFALLQNGDNVRPF